MRKNELSSSRVHTGRRNMPIATPEVYGEMIDRAKQKGFAYPAINVTSSQTLNAALQGFTEAGSDGIVQISTGGAEYASGQKVKEMVTGAVALAEYARVVAKDYPRPSRSRRTSRSPRSCSPAPRRPRSSWRSRSVPSVARRTASPGRSTRSSTPPSPTACVPSRCWAPGRRGVISPR